MPTFRRARQTRTLNCRPSTATIQILEDRRVLTPLVALTSSNEIVTFDSSNPEELIASNQVTGLARGEKLVGIDVRPATGELYGLTNKGQLYTIDAATGSATFKAKLTADPSDTTSPFRKLTGSTFGFDFNPTVDRLRVTSNSDINLRINVDNGFVITDTPLDYVSEDANGRRNPNVVASAYLNPDNDPATGTALFGIDSKLGTVVSQAPANDGTLSTIGSLGLNVRPELGFDVDSEGTVFAALTPQRGRREAALYTIDLETGAASLVGTIGNGLRVTGLAALLPVQPVYAVTTDNNLISFNSARPDILTSKTAVTGLQPGDAIDGIDFRPATGELYALASSGALYTIDIKTGAATLQTPALAADPSDQTAPFTGIAGSDFGFDFNPVVDRLRVVSDADNNLRINVGTGLVFTDTPLAFASGDVNSGADPRIVASAYSSNFPGTTTTMLMGIDSELDVVVLQNPANDGALTTIGDLGVNTGGMTSFDVSSGGDVFAALTLEGEASTGFYTIDLSTGAATLVGTIGGVTTPGGETVRAMAIAPALVEFAKPASTVSENAGPAQVAVIRRGDTTTAVVVNAEATPGTAVADEDFSPITTTIEFAPGETSKLLSVPILDDAEAEENETVSLALGTPLNGGGATLGLQSTAELTIADNDGRRGRGVVRSLLSFLKNR